MKKTSTILGGLILGLILLGIAPPAYSQSVVKIKLGTVAPKDTLWHQVLQEMAQDWKEISGGTVKVTIYPGGNMGDEVAMLRKVRLGQLQAVALSGAGLSHAEPGVSCLQVPMMISSYAELDYVELALQIAEALEAAHEKGVIHRDLKPANIKVTSEGKVKVLDFGLVKAYAGTAVGDETILETLTEDAESGKGVLLGTPAYMSPEQARCQPADHRSDVWAFGCVLFEMLSGKTLFKGNTLSDTIAAILEREPEFGTTPTDLSPAIRRLLKRCLEKNPKRRWQAIGDVRLEVEAALTEDVFVPADLPDNPRARSLPYVVAILGVLMAIPLGWYLRTVLRPEPRAVTRFEYELPPIERFEGGLSLAISPNGRQVVSGSSDGLVVRSMDEIATRHISGTEGELISAPFFSPDAQWVGYWSPNEGLLKKVPIGGGTPIVLTGAEQPYGPFWTSDDSILYVQTNQGNNSAIVSVSANGGIPEILFEREGSIFNPIVLPDRRSVLFAIGPAYDARVVARSLESGDEKVLFSGGGVFYFVTTGHLVYQLENDVVARRFDPETWEAGPPVVLLQNVLRGGVAGPLYFDVSESGSLIYAQGIQPGLGTPVWVTRDGHEDEALADSPLTRPQHPRLSPDASRFAMSELGDIWVYDVAGRPPMKVTFDGSNLSPLWTPDGQRIVYEGASGYGSGSPSSLWAVSADGSSAVPERVSPEGHFHPHGWSGDGLELLADFAEGANGIDIVRWQIAEPDDFESVVATPADEGRWGATLSPDGRWLAYDSNLTGNQKSGSDHIRGLVRQFACPQTAASNRFGPAMDENSITSKATP